MRVGVHLRQTGQLDLLGRGQLELDRFDDRGGHLGLQRQYVRELAGVALGPEVLVGVGANQLGGDAHLRPGAQHGALDHPVDVQLPRDLAKRLVHALVLHGRGSGDHPERPDAGQRRRELLG